MADLGEKIDQNAKKLGLSMDEESGHNAAATAKSTRTVNSTPKNSTGIVKTAPEKSTGTVKAAPAKSTPPDEDTGPAKSTAMEKSTAPAKSTAPKKNGAPEKENVTDVSDSENENTKEPETEHMTTDAEVTDPETQDSEKKKSKTKRTSKKKASVNDKAVNDEPIELKLKLWLHDGELKFVETNGKFIDFLISIIVLPVTEILTFSANAPDQLKFANLANIKDSISKLRKETFHKVLNRARILNGNISISKVFGNLIRTASDEKKKEYRSEGYVKLEQNYYVFDNLKFGSGNAVNMAALALAMATEGTVQESVEVVLDSRKACHLLKAILEKDKVFTSLFLNNEYEDDQVLANIEDAEVALVHNEDDQVMGW